MKKRKKEKKKLKEEKVVEGSLLADLI